MQAQVSSSPLHHVRQGAFTLIEVLVVITITSLLVSIIIPALSSARDQAQQLICSSSMRQTALLTFVYAEDNKYYLPHATNYPSPSATAIASGAVAKPHLAWSQVIDLTDPSTRLRRCPGTGSIRFFWATRVFGPFVPGGTPPTDETPNLRYHAPNINFMTRNDEYVTYVPKKLTSIRKNHHMLMLAVDTGGTDRDASQRAAGGSTAGDAPRYRHAKGEAVNLSFMDGHAESWARTTTYEAYVDYFLRSPRVYNPRLLHIDNSNNFYPWGYDSPLNPN